MNLLTSLSEKDFIALHDFEIRNWEYFGQFVPARPDSYRDFDLFCKTQNALLLEQTKGKCGLYVVYKANKIIARINLTEIVGNVADIGYRVCQSVSRQGIATQAISSLIQIADKRGIEELNAIVSHTNPASESVLLKNGFCYIRTEENAYELNGHLLNFRYFKRQLD